MTYAASSLVVVVRDVTNCHNVKSGRPVRRTAELSLTGELIGL
ncbi:MAG TPA: hypothetical protein VMS18_14330 [Candidatus Binatia bacterium]|nr:hypothetical protein [Candidatus Binatia bacterium]